MNSFSLGVADLREATGWGRQRARMIVLRPYSLSYKQDPSGSKGGGMTRRYRLSDFLTRCREKTSFSDQMENHLIAADAAYRKEYMK